VTFLAAVSGTASSAAGSALNTALNTAVNRTANSAAGTPAPNDVQAGVLGFLVVASIGVALVFLLRSMNKQFKKIGPKPGEPGEALAGQVVAGEVVAEPGRGADGDARSPGGGAESGAEHVAGGARPTADVKSTGD
jgi:hypothetical protein